MDAFQNILDILDFGDCSLLVPVLIMIWLGQHVVGNNDVLKARGVLASIVVFFLYFIYAFLKYEVSDSQLLAEAALRATMAAGLTLGASWMMLPVLASLHQASFGAIFHAAADTWRQWRHKVEVLKLQREEAARQEEARKRHCAWLASLPPPEDRSTKLQRFQREYEEEVQHLRTLGLDQDELEFAELNAKRKYLRRIKEELQ